MSLLGYDSFNLVLNLGTISVAYVSYILLINLFFLVLIPMKLMGFKFVTKRYQEIKNKVFFGWLVVISLGGFFEIVLSTYLTIFGPKEIKDTQGFMLGAAYILSFVCFIFLPISLGYIQTRSVSELADPDFQERWGMIYLNLDINKKSKLFYSFTFIARRLMFVIIGFSLDTFTGLQIIALNYMNLA